MSNLVAVLTGDLIGSTEAGPDRTERAMQLLQAAAKDIGAAETRFTRYRGDGWQILLREPGKFLGVAVFLNALLKGDTTANLQTRIAIGLGPFDSLGPSGLAAARGTAFKASGHALDKMDATDQTLALAGTSTDDIQRSLIAFVEDRMAGWSREQAEVVALKLAPASTMTQGDIAARLGIMRQAVGARLQSAGFDLILRACDALQNHPVFQPAT